MAGIADVTPHTLRHTFASVAGDLGLSELTIAALLGHASRGAAQRYVHIDEALRMAADKVAREIAGILDGSVGRPRITDRQPIGSEPALGRAPV
jgi:integrase